MFRRLVWMLLLILPLTACGQSQPAPVQAGVDYEVLQPGMRWTPANGKIEVVEVFAYWCPHCNDFQPMVDAWKKTMPADVEFSYVPAAFDPDDTYGKAYFAAEMANAVPKIHHALFDAIHEAGALPQQNPTIDEVGTWFAQQGLNRAKMIGWMQSKEVAARMARARDFAKTDRVSGTPTLIVNGKYVVRARALQDRFRVVDALIALERGAAKPKR